MRRAILALSSTIAGLVLLLSFKTHVPGVTDSGTTASSGGGSGGESGAGTGAGSADMAGAGHAGHTSSKPRRARPRSGPASRTVTGTVAETMYGPMQVQLTLTGQSITKVTVLRRTDDGAESNEIDADAIPRLIDETLAVQSARINAVSGASYTSAGYRHSLQSALDQAGA